MISSHPVLSCAEAKALEFRLLAGKTAEWTAMQEAGAAIAREIVEDYREIGGFPANGRILVLAGKGHNGGDALLAAAELLRRFPQASAEVIFAFGEAELRPLAAKAWGILRGTALQSRVSLRAPATALESHATDLCLDGLFGMQFRLPLDEKVAELLARVNTHPRIRFRAAVDLPSGLGEGNAGTVFRADFTYATGIVKTPVLQPSNAPFVGRVRYLDLGFFSRLPELPPAGVAQVDDLRGPRVLTPEILVPLTALRRPQSDKRTYGHLFILGGSLSYPGAVVLAVRAALRSGVGLVTAFVPERLVPEYAAKHPEAMWVGCPVNAAGAMTPAALPRIHERLTRATALVVGPGLSANPEALALAAQLVDASTVPLVLDADALRPEVVEKAQGKPFIVTPHAGELQRIEKLLFDGSPPTNPAGVVIAKGPMTRILAPQPDRHQPPSTTHPSTYYSLHGGPVLARGGSGDILAGLCGGLVAQTPAELLLAACRGVVWHGRAADLLARARGQVAVELSEIFEHLGPALTSAPCPPPNP